MFILLGLLFAAVAFMLVYLLWKNRRDARYNGWKKDADQLIYSVIFLEDDEPIEVSGEIEALLRNPAFRECLIEELITAVRNLAGTAAINLRKLYSRLGLDKDSEEKMTSLKWHIKARGIQELAAMDRRDKLRKIYRHTDNGNEFIRMEAQLAIVHMFGHQGLRFLDVVSQPITEWQQIKLLSQLPAGTDDDLAGMGRWLKSPNSTVTSFALKLAATHRRFDMHDAVAETLTHADPTIRIQAVKTLEQIANETTPHAIMRQYRQNEKPYRLATLEALGNMASEEQLKFLRKALSEEDHQLKLAAARALAKMGDPGIQVMNHFAKAREYPWSEIFKQAKSEIAA